MRDRGALVTAQLRLPGRERRRSPSESRGPPGLWPPTSPSFSARHLVSAVPATEHRSGRVRSQQSLDVPSLSPGDAVLLLWRARPSEMAKTISLVVHCSWQIQKKHRKHDMLVGQKFRLKIGTSAVPGADLWHSPVPQGASHWQGMWRSFSLLDSPLPFAKSKGELHCLRP